jgi:CysZ protein
MLWRGFRLWGSRPGAMLLGAVPALVVGAVYAAGFVALALNIEGVVTWLTPFAADWDETGRQALVVLLGAAILIGVGALGVVSFTAVALVVGDPVYERIWRASEQVLGGLVEAPIGFWRSAGDAIVLLLRSIGAGLLAALAGLVPVVGPIASTVLGLVLGGLILSRELLVRPLEARGIDSATLGALLRGHRARALGLGVMTQACFLVPGGALLVMPAAVVAATDLARRLAPAAGASAPPAPDAMPSPDQAPGDSGRPSPTRP